jgi:hypothetical protein
MKLQTTGSIWWLPDSLGEEIPDSYKELSNETPSQLGLLKPSTYFER